MQPSYRSHQNAQYGREISEILGTQSARMEQAARDAHLWRPIQAEPPSQIASTSAAPSVAIRQESVANFDFATLPVSLVTDLIVANLQAIPIESLQAAIQVREGGWLPICSRLLMLEPIGLSTTKRARSSATTNAHASICVYCCFTTSPANTTHSGSCAI